MAKILNSAPFIGATVFIYFVTMSFAADLQRECRSILNSSGKPEEICSNIDDPTIDKPINSLEELILNSPNVPSAGTAQGGGGGGGGGGGFFKHGGFIRGKIGGSSGIIEKVLPVPSLQLPSGQEFSPSSSFGGISAETSASVLSPIWSLISPSEMPPRDVAAYGIVAFTSLPLQQERARYLAVCEAFKSALLSRAMAAGVPVEQQMITFWPVTESQSERAKASACDFMVESYDLKAGLEAIRDADQQKGGLAQKRGPFLIAWSPSSSRTRPDPVILVIDMSGLESAESFRETFLAWRQKIIDDPKFWHNGFSLEQIRLTLRDLVDRYGEALIPFVPSKK